MIPVGSSIGAKGGFCICPANIVIRAVLCFCLKSTPPLADEYKRWRAEEGKMCKSYSSDVHGGVLTSFFFSIVSEKKKQQSQIIQ